MRKKLVIVVIAVLALAGVVVYRRSDNPSAAGTATGAPQGQGGRGAGAGGPVRPPMPVEFATVKRASLAEQIQVVGSLIGAATVQVVPKVNGRLQTVFVKMGDSVRRGQTIAKVEDREIQEQVRQAEASFEVSRASIRQRDADLKLAQTNLERSRSLFERQLLPRQTFDDVDARHQAALAQVDLARAQFEQARARVDELKITLGNTIIPSPVDGFVAKRFLDPGAFVSANAPVVSVVDIRTVRMVANLVEKDVQRIDAGTRADVQVDAYPGEVFKGRVSRVAPIFDPATRTAEMEIEVPNPGYRLKPGMYARVDLTVDTRANALTVPRNAVVDLGGKPGVFLAAPTPADARQPADPKVMTAKFQPVETGIRAGEQIEITSGLPDGARVITTGAGALKDGDRIVAAGNERTPGGRGAPQGNGQGAPRPGGNR